MHTPPEWRKIPGLHSRHEVSSDGRFRTAAFISGRGHRMPARDKKVCFSRVGKSYFAGMVRVSDGGKEKVHLIHRLVAAAPQEVVLQGEFLDLLPFENFGKAGEDLHC